MNTSDLKTFNYLENGEISFSVYDTIKSSSILDSGSYILSWIGHPEYRVLIKLNSDFEELNIHQFPDKLKIDGLLASFFRNGTL
jgi:hypothetical protein